MVAIEEPEIEEPEGEVRRPRTPLPRDLFSRIVGYADVKHALRTTLLWRLPVHHWLIGPPASGKSIFAEEICRLPGARWIDGSHATGPGIRRVILEEDPEQLVLDEVDHLDPDAVEALYPIVEQGVLRVTTGRLIETHPTDVQVFMTSNSTRNTRSSFWTRFEKWELQEYTRAQFARVAEHIVLDMGGAPLMGTYIAKRLWDRGSRSIRDVRTVATMCGSRRQIDDYINSPHRVSTFTREF